MPKLLENFKLTEGMKSLKLVTAALTYAKVGLPVIPIFGVDDDLECLCGSDECEAQGKHPIVKGGFKSATTDPDQIRLWWAEHPEANIASPLMTGLNVLDFDGKKGLKSYKKLGLDGFETLKVKTGNGFHLYVLGSLKARNNAMSGLDIRGGGEGGYIILPPSRHVSGVRYEWEV